MGETFWEPEELELFRKAKERRKKLDRGELNHLVTGFYDHKIPLSDEEGWNPDILESVRLHKTRSDDL